MNPAFPEVRTRVLAITAFAPGLAFAVLEGNGQDSELVDWGISELRRDRETVAEKRLHELLERYQPDRVALEDPFGTGFRRPPRIVALNEMLFLASVGCGIDTVRLKRDAIKRLFFPNSNGTMEDIARIIAQRYPEQLSFRLPPKRRAWMGYNRNFAIFHAVALGLCAT